MAGFLPLGRWEEDLEEEDWDTTVDDCRRDEDCCGGLGVLYFSVSLDLELDVWLGFVGRGSSSSLLLELSDWL